MKRLFAAFAALLISAALFAVSYTNNTYQKLADEYTKKAEKAKERAAKQAAKKAQKGEK